MRPPEHRAMDASILDRLLTEDSSYEFLVSLGLPIGQSTWHKLCLRRERPVPVATTFLGRKLRDPLQILEWIIHECDPPPPQLISALSKLRTQRGQSKPFEQKTRTPPAESDGGKQARAAAVIHRQKKVAP
jgi:hypothetical protein